MELRTTRQKVEKIEEYLKKNGYFSSSAKDDRYKFYTYYKYLMPRILGETGCYIKVEMMHAYAHEWYVTAQIKLFRFDGISRIYHYAEIQRAMLDVNDMGRVNKLAELVLNNKELIME